MMLDKDNILDIKNIFPKEIRDQFIFPLDTYRVFLEDLSINPPIFFNKWSDINLQSIINKYWHNDTKLDWKWSLSFPLFSLLENYIDNNNNPTIIGFSGLPGSGKSTLGFWIDNVARELNLDIKVISLDDFYLPSNEMDIAVRGNPWNVPRGFPGTHSIELLNKSLEVFLKTGILNCPTFDKSLRDGKGDRSGWCEFKPKVLILEGWFVGCEPISNLIEIDYVFDDKCNLCLSQNEKDYRASIQDSLSEYSQTWNMLDKIWHLKSSNYNNTILWKTEQEEEMIKLKGTGLKDTSLANFIRMIQASIPQESLSCLNSDTTIEINELRRVNNIFTKKYKF